MNTILTPRIYIFIFSSIPLPNWYHAYTPYIFLVFQYSNPRPIPYAYTPYMFLFSSIALPGEYHAYVPYMFLFSSIPLPGHYIPPNEKDFICGQVGTGGMTTCEDIPRFKYNNMTCNSTAVPWSSNTPTNDSCVNWNQYYTKCKAGVANPFKGAISFDNIGLAWVAIFQVSIM